MENSIKTILISEEEIKSITASLAEKITEDYKNSDKTLVVLGLLKGSLLFMADLIQRIPLPLEIELMKVSSYGKATVSTGIINIQFDIARTDLSEVDILVVEDIIDSGNTLSRICTHLSERGAASVKTCTLLDKPSRREVDFVPDYCGKVIPDEFVVGYGLDYDEKYRNLPYIGVLKPEVYGAPAEKS